MGKKLKQTIDHCGECPHLHIEGLFHSRDSHYCILNHQYVTMSVYKKEVHEKCPLEEEEGIC